MKITIAFTPEEEQAARASAAALLRLHPGARYKKTTSKPPYQHIFVTTRKPKNVDISTGMLDIPPGGML